VALGRFLQKPAELAAVIKQGRKKQVRINSLEEQQQSFLLKKVDTFT